MPRPSRTTPPRKTAIARATKKAKEKLIGKVVHYYDRIGVAIIDLKSSLRLGDTVKLKRGEKEMLQEVASMQINHEAVAKARKGDVIGIRVDVPVATGTRVIAM